MPGLGQKLRTGQCDVLARVSMTCITRLARAISVFVPIVGLSAVGALNGDRWGLTKLLTWGGLRGGLALALALSLPDSSTKPLIVNMTFAVVAFSILVQGPLSARSSSPTT